MTDIKKIILNKCIVENGYHYLDESSCFQAMGEYAAAMAVAFAEWKEKENIFKRLDGFYFYGNGLYTHPELYKYWIENIYKP